MNIRLLSLCLLTAAAPVAFAQNVLTVLESSGPQIVRGMNLGTTLIEKNGQLVSSSGTSYALRKASVYGRGFIKFSNLALKDTRVEDLTKGTTTVFPTDLDANVMSDTLLKHCYIVFEITSGLDKGNHLSEMRDLVPGELQKIRVSAALQEHLENGRYLIHVFSDGFEILNSTMDEAYVAEQMKKTEEALLKRQPDHPVTISRRVPPAVPVYPADLKAQGVAGSAKVSCTIDAHGDVVAVEVVETTNPLFGESLAAAAKQWKFEPAVKDHQYVEAKAVIPYTFKLPAPEAK